jgi:deazaflavin-dependent oxidoreductase (nitroreductase family)
VSDLNDLNDLPSVRRSHTCCRDADLRDISTHSTRHAAARLRHRSTPVRTTRPSTPASRYSVGRVTSDEYAASPQQWVRDQVAKYESTGGAEGNTLRGRPIIILTTRGNRTGKIRKTPLMRVEYNGSYAVVASLGGAPKHPVWYYNVTADPHVQLQDGPNPKPYTAHEAKGPERTAWWDRAVEAWPAYADYQKKTDRQIPIFVLDPA